jgi:hypothetical protein
MRSATHATDGSLPGSLPGAPPPSAAYPVPFVVDRRHPPLLRFTNTGSELLTGVTFTLMGSGVMPLARPRSIAPAQTITLPVLGADLARSSILIVRWFRPSGAEFLWRVSF